MSENKKRPLPPVEFSGLILGLSSAALEALGYIEDSNAKRPPNFGLARHNIDIIEMLAKKTDGNLNEQEQTLILSVLHDLRQKYVELSKP